MTTLREFDVTAPKTSRGRTVKFTPERMEQIRNLVERGVGREEIAEIIGVTLGSLQVTCSRAGISLRCPRHGATISNGNGVNIGMAKKPTPPIVVGPPHSPASAPEPSGQPFNRDKTNPTFTLRVAYGDRTYNLPLAIDNHTLCELACMADSNGVTLSEMLARALVAGVQEIMS